MLVPVSGLPDRSPAQKRRSFLVLVLALAVGVAVVAFALARGGGDGTSGASPSSSDATTSPAEVTLETACEEIAPDMTFRVDALRRTANRVRDDIAAMQALGNDADAAKATTVAKALERLADAQDSQKGVSRAMRELGQALTSNC